MNPGTKVRILFVDPNDTDNGVDVGDEGHVEHVDGDLVYVNLGDRQNYFFDDQIEVIA